METNYESYLNNLEDNIELRKAIAKLEDILNKKHSENEILIQIQQDLKTVNEKMRKECSDLNHKLVQLLNQKKNQEKKHDSEINKLRSYFDKQKEVYESQLLKLTNQDAEILKHKLSAEFELKNKHLIQQREIEIENLNDQIFEWKRKFELLQTDYESFKNESIREIDLLKENHRTEVKEYLFKIQVLNEKCEKNNEKESMRSLKHELDSYRRNFSDLQSEITNLRKEKELILSEKNEIKITYLKELDQEKLKNKVVNNDNEKLQLTLKNIESDLQNMKNQTSEKNEEIKNLMVDKFNLSKVDKIRESEHESLKNEVHILRQKILQREKENEDLLRQEHDKEKQRLIDYNSEKDESRKKIEELTNNLREVQTDFKNYYEKSNEDLHNYKRDFYIIQEEKRNLIRKITDLSQEIENLKFENTKNLKNLESFQKEYENLQKSYRDICNVGSDTYNFKKEYEQELKLKNEEIENLKKLIKNNDSAIYGKSQTNNYYEKYLDAINKKKHYKQQVIYS
jgi:chromosome segregation ATPase